MKQEDMELLKETLKTPKKFIETHCKIITKTGKFQKMKLNKQQDKVCDYIEECIREKKKVRIRILKCRQLGMSTFIAALFTWLLVTHENLNLAIVAHNAESSEILYSRVKLMIENLPEILRPSIDKLNSERTRFDKLRTSLKFATAGSPDKLRGDTIQAVHESERAFYDNVDKLDAAVGNAVPNEPFTFIIAETTANGYNHFKNEWDLCMSGDSQYKGFFFSWKDFEEYQMEVPENFKLLDIEVDYMLEHDLTMEQMAWRRYQLIDVYNYSMKDIEYDDIDVFKQEMPITPEEAFISSGTNVFNARVIQQGMQYAKKQEYKKYEIQSVAMSEDLLMYEVPQIEEKKIFQQKPVYDEDLDVYNYVDNKEVFIKKEYHYTPYLLSIDTSGAGTDNNVICVFDTIRKVKVAQWKRKNISEELLAKVAVEIAKLYNNAMIAPEVNFSHSLVNFIVDFEDYDNVYEFEDFTKATKKTNLEYGWKTTTVTKPMIVSYMKKALNNDYKVCPDIDFWREAEYYIMDKSPTGRDTYNAAPGKHDDIIVATMIGRFLCDSPQVQTTKKVSDVKMQKIDTSISKMLENVGIIPKRKTSDKTYRKGMFKNEA